MVIILNKTNIMSITGAVVNCYFIQVEALSIESSALDQVSHRCFFKVEIVSELFLASPKCAEQIFELCFFETCDKF